MATQPRPIGHPSTVAQITTMLAILGALAGCAGPVPGIPFLGKSEKSSQERLAQSKTPSLPLAPKNNSARRATLAAKELGKSKKSRIPGADTAKSLTSAFRRATKSLTFSKPTDGAEDPTSLFSDPGPINPAVFIASARLFEQQGKTDRAIDHYQKAIKIEPNNRDALIGYARLKHRVGDVNEAIQLYHRVLQKNPNDAVALNDLGFCYARLGQIDQAIASVTRAVQAAPQEVRYRNNAARFLVQANRLDEALAYLTSAHGSAKGLYNLGHLLNQRGNRELAMQYFAKALEIDPNLRAAQVMLAQGQGQSDSAVVQSYYSTSPANSARYGGATASQVVDAAAQLQYDGATVPPTAVPSGVMVTQGGVALSPNAPGPFPAPAFLQVQSDRAGPYGYEPAGAPASYTVQTNQETLAPAMRMPAHHYTDPSGYATVPPNPPAYDPSVIATRPAPAPSPVSHPY